VQALPSSEETQQNTAGDVSGCQRDAAPADVRLVNWASRGWLPTRALVALRAFPAGASKHAVDTSFENSAAVGVPDP
jgi:hypothetical protein